MIEYCAIYRSNMPESLSFARGLPLRFSSFTAFSHQMFFGKSDELASVFSHQNKPVFNVEDVEKYGFGAIPDCSGKINFMTKCVRSILSKVRSVEHSHRNICEISRDLFVSTIFRALSANGNPEVLTCSPALTSNAVQQPAATVKSLISSPSRTMPDGMGGVQIMQAPGGFSAAPSYPVSVVFTLLAVVACAAALA